MKVSDLAKITVAAASLLALASCKQLETTPNVGPCPVSGALYDVARLVEVSEPERHENVAFTGEIEGVHGSCRYIGKAPITIDLSIDFAFGRGPKAVGEAKSYPYFVTVTRRDRSVLAKQEFAVQVKFPKGRSVVRKTEKLSGIVIPRATGTVSGTNFEVIVGFDLTPEELAFNRSGKRFTMEVKK